MPHLHAEQYAPLEVSTNRGQHQLRYLQACLIAVIRATAIGQNRSYSDATTNLFFIALSFPAGSSGSTQELSAGISGGLV